MLHTLIDIPYSSFRNNTSNTLSLCIFYLRLLSLNVIRNHFYLRYGKPKTQREKVLVKPTLRPVHMRVQSAVCHYKMIQMTQLKASLSVSVSVSVSVSLSLCVCRM